MTKKTASLSSCSLMTMKSNNSALEREFTKDNCCSSPLSSSSQLLVKFCNRTHVLNLDPDTDTNTDTDTDLSSHSSSILKMNMRILALISHRTGWPLHRLYLQSYTFPFCTVSVRSSIRGGKGGFGTLLKGQSRQAAQTTTLDFSACRDLQGRRLRTVNDELVQRIHQEWLVKVQSGQATHEDMIRGLAQTPSGVAGWFLQLPAWAEKSVRKVAKRKHHAQFRHWKRQALEKAQRERQKKEQEQLHVANYVQATNASLSLVTSQIQQAVQQGLLAKTKQQHLQQQQQQQLEPAPEESRKRKHDLTTEEQQQQQQQPSEEEDNDGDGDGEDDDDDGDRVQDNDKDEGPPSALVTLSGEVIEINETVENIDNNNNNNDTGTAATNNNDDTNVSCRRVQGTSNFATVGVLVQGRGANGNENGKNENKSSDSGRSGNGLYYEVVVVSGGLAQVGWVLQHPPQSTIAAATPDGEASSAALSLSSSSSSFPFLNSESGDGVGDVPGSWSYDGSRQIKLQYHRPSTTTTTSSTTEATPVAMECTEGKKNDTPATTTTCATSSATETTTTSTEPYGQLWKAGDVVGCLYHNNTIRFFLNGNDLGLAFDGVVGRDSVYLPSPEQHPEQEPPVLVPAVSLNPGEIIEFRLHQHEMQYFPTASANDSNSSSGGVIIPVGDVLLERLLLKTEKEQATTPNATAAIKTTTTAMAAITGETVHRNDPDTERPLREPLSNEQTADLSVENKDKGGRTSEACTQSLVVQEESSKGALVEETTTHEPINLDDFDSVEQLERMISLARLKVALVERGLKCGGTLRERATRLFSVKGLSPQEYPAKLLAKKK